MVQLLLIYFVIYCLLGLDIEALLTVAQEGYRKALSRVSDESSSSCCRIKSAPPTVREREREREI